MFVTIYCRTTYGPAQACCHPVWLAIASKYSNLHLYEVSKLSGQPLPCVVLHAGRHNRLGSNGLSNPDHSCHTKLEPEGGHSSDGDTVPDLIYSDSEPDEELPPLLDASAVQRDTCLAGSEDGVGDDEYCRGDSLDSISMRS